VADDRDNEAVEHIADPDDARLGDFTGLREARRRARRELAEGFFVAEGVTVVRRLLGTTLRVRAVAVLPSRLQRIADLIGPDTPCYVVDPAVMETLVGFDLHRGVLASAERPAPPTVADVAGSARTVAVLEGINDYENLGAIARTAAALGADALVVDPTTADPWYRRSVRVSMGEILTLPVARSGDWPADLAVLAAAGFTLVALSPAGNVDLATLAQHRPAKVAVMLGAEGPGLSAAALAAAHRVVRIPIRAEVDSLNVGHAAAIALAALADPGPR